MKHAVQMTNMSILYYILLFSLAFFRINQHFAFKLGPRWNIRNYAQVMMLLCEQESCICRKSRMRAAALSLIKKQDYTSLIKLNFPLSNTIAGLQGCIEPPRVLSGQCQPLANAPLLEALQTATINKG